MVKASKIEKEVSKNTKTITQFLQEDYSPAALYISYRALPSAIDGLKNSTRKLIYTIKKNNISSEIKVSSLGGKVTTDSGYLHGDASIQSVIVTAAQDYCGANNLPPMEPHGNFGTRMMPAASAARYIFTKPQKYFYELFKKADDINLITQEFEGDEIEPRFYVPTVPLVLINGCTGIGVGFASKILCRDPKNIIKALRSKLQGVRILKRYFYPAWNGFKGTVVDLGNNKWKISGVASLKSKKKLIIEEIPITYDLLGYIDVLKKLKDKGVIDGFDDLSENDNFQFEVTLGIEEAKKPLDQIMDDLKLTVNITESLTCLDENNAIVEYNSIEQIFNKYYDIKIQYLEKRIQSEIARLTKEKTMFKEIVDFINEIIAGTINLKLKREFVVDTMKKKGYTSIDKLLGMPLHSLTEEKVQESLKKYKDKEAELEQMKKETPTTLWLKDLDELEKNI